MSRVNTKISRLLSVYRLASRPPIDELTRDSKCSEFPSSGSALLESDESQLASQRDARRKIPDMAFMSYGNRVISVASLRNQLRIWYNVDIPTCFCNHVPTRKALRVYVERSVAG